ncbi:MAG: hypothetical protein QME75_16130 [Deltaproteobacteria bacterium]|nr:hypothetical protein [Deltaproteobacteria bacterium]
MDWLLSLLFSKAGAALAGALGVLAYWLRTALLRRRAEQAEARARAAEARAEIQKAEAEYAPKIEEVEKAGQAGDAAGVADAVNRHWGLRDGKAGPGQTGVAEAGAKESGGAGAPEDG